MIKKISILPLLLFASLLFCSCATIKVSDEVTLKYYDTHKGKSLETLKEEMKEKFENRCFTRSVYGGCYFKILEVGDYKITANANSDQPYFYYGQMPELTLLLPGQFYVIEYDGDSFVFGEKNKVLELYGYLTSIYNLTKVSKNKFANTKEEISSSTPAPKIDSSKNWTLNRQNLTEKYYALLIANSAYSNLPDLETPERDALGLEKILKSKYEFNVRTLVNAKRDDVITALYNYRKTLEKEDSLLIFYAGHGWLDKEADEGYWLPVDAVAENPIDWISNSSITSAIRAMKSNHVVVISDSCFSGKLTRGIIIEGTNRAYIDGLFAKKARIVISSGGLEPVLDAGGSRGHSVFASALLDSLSASSGILDTTSLFSQIRSKVTWNADQVPELGIIHKAGHEGGDFFFIPKTKNE